jgi:hypothetical protein
MGLISIDNSINFYLYKVKFYFKVLKWLIKSIITYKKFKNRFLRKVKNIKNGWVKNICLIWWN